MFLGHFWPVLPNEDFLQKIQLSNTTAKFQKKLMSRSQEKLRTDGSRDRHTLFYRTLPAKARDLTTSLQQVSTPNLVLRLKKDKKENLYKRENFKPEIKPMIENLQN